MTGFPWAILVACIILGIAFLVKHFAAKIVEDENVFLLIIGAFLVLYIIAAILVGSLNPKLILSNFSS